MAALFLILDITGHAATWGGALAIFGEPAIFLDGQMPAPPDKRVMVLETTRTAAMQEAELMARYKPGRTFGLFRAARVQQRRSQAPRTRAVVRLLLQTRRPRRPTQSDSTSAMVSIAHMQRPVVTPLSPRFFSSFA